MTLGQSLLDSICFNSSRHQKLDLHYPLCFGAPPFIYTLFIRLMRVTNENYREFKSITKLGVTVPETGLISDTNCKFGGFSKPPSGLIIHYKKCIELIEGNYAHSNSLLKEGRH